MRIEDQMGQVMAQNNRQNPTPPKAGLGDESAVFELPPEPTDETASPPPTTQQNAADSGTDSTDADAPKTNYEKIVEVGFSQFVADLEEEKLKKLREKILGAMGLSEEALAKMSPDQREVIEKMIAAEIKRRIEGGAVMNGSPNEDKIAPGQDPGGENLASGGMSIGNVVDGGTLTKGGDISQGLGPLLALQDINESDAQTAFSDGLEKVGKKGPYGL